MPRSSARPTVLLASSASNAPQSPPNDHVPKAIAETSRSVLPSRTYRTVFSRVRIRASADTQRELGEIFALRASAARRWITPPGDLIAASPLAPGAVSARRTGSGVGAQ